MHLVQLLLPVRDNAGHPRARELDGVRRELTEKFGGVTAYVRAPASGVWKRPEGEVDVDEMIMVEVIVEALDRLWWERYRRDLERRFAQDELHVRALAIEKL
jgi:hypothetical protein